MKKLILLVLLIFVLPSCNMFDPIEPTGNHFLRCQNLSDKGKYEKAIEACRKADPDGTNEEVQVEIADIYLTMGGFTLGHIAEVFLNTSSNKDENFSLFRNLAEKILENNPNVSSVEKTWSLNAIEAFDNTGKEFHKVLARVCYVATILASTKSDDRGSNENLGKIYEEDVCNDASCQTICEENENNTACDGITYQDAALVATAMEEMVDIGEEGYDFGIENLNDFLGSFLEVEIDFGGDIRTIKTAEEDRKGDVARQILMDMAR
jgi:hypothetical protein